MKVQIGSFNFTNFNDAVAYAMRKYNFTRKKAEIYVKQLEIQQRTSDTQAKKQSARIASREMEKSFDRLDKEVRQKQKEVHRLVNKMAPSYKRSKGAGRRGEWWRISGVNNNNCLAAFESIHANSLAESYRNLAVPGSNEITATTPPTLDRLGWKFVAASTQYLTVGSGALVSAVPFTIIALVQVGADSTIAAICNTSAYNTFLMQPTLGANGYQVYSYAIATPLFPYAASTGVCAANVWFTACSVFESATSRHAYLNRSPRGSNTTSSTPSSLDTTLIGVGHNGTDYAGYYDGRIGAIAFYDIALQDSQIYQISRDLMQLV